MKSYVNHEGSVTVPKAQTLVLLVLVGDQLELLLYVTVPFSNLAELQSQKCPRHTYLSSCGDQISRSYTDPYLSGLVFSNSSSSRANLFATSDRDLTSRSYTISSITFGVSGLTVGTETSSTEAFLARVSTHST